MEAGGYGRGRETAPIGSASAVPGWPAIAADSAPALPRRGAQVALAGAPLARTWGHSIPSFSSCMLSLLARLI